METSTIVVLAVIVLGGVAAIYFLSRSASGSNVTGTGTETNVVNPWTPTRDSKIFGQDTLNRTQYLPPAFPPSKDSSFISRANPEREAEFRNLFVSRSLGTPSGSPSVDEAIIRTSLQANTIRLNPINGAKQ